MSVYTTLEVCTVHTVQRVHVVSYLAMLKFQLKIIVDIILRAKRLPSNPVQVRIWLQVKISVLLLAVF
jgi:hypothetical protein